MNKNNNIKQKNYSRKVIILQCEDKQERVILTRTTKMFNESFKIKSQYETKPVEENKTVTQNEKYPLFRAQLRDRIVPRCFRDKCKRDVQYKTNQCKTYRHRKPGQKSESSGKNKNVATASIITISDDEYEGLQYENISSCTEDEIDTLMESTRKRMKDSDQEWNLLPRQRSLINGNHAKENINYNRLSKSASLSSLDTLFLEDIEKILTTPILNTLYSPNSSPEQIQKLYTMETNHTKAKRRLTYDVEPRRSPKRKDSFHKIEHEQSSPKKKIKLEPIEINNREKKSVNKRSKPSVQENRKFEKNGDQTNRQQHNAENPKAEMIIKQESSETNNNITVEDKKIC